VLAASGRRGARPYHELAADAPCAGVGVRVDLSRGVTRSAEGLLDLCASAGLRPWVLVPAAAAGDLGYAREGRLVPDSRGIEALLVLAGRAAGLGLLADPTACIHRFSTSPFAVWRTLAATLSAAGSPLSGIGCSFHDRLPASADMVWAYRVAGRLERADHWHLLSHIPFSCREWLSEKDPEPLFARPLDGVERLSVWIEDSPPAFCRGMGVVSQVRVRRRLQLEFDAVAHTDREGWVLLRRGGEARSASTAEVVDAIEAARPPARIGLVLDPADVRWPAGRLASVESSAAPLRPLPYPFHHFLSISSDIDWSTHEQFQAVVETLCDVRGLTFAGSAYGLSRNPAWPAWEEVALAVGDRAGVVAGWAGQGLLDTIHGIAHSFDPVVVAADLQVDGSAMIRLDAPLDLRGYDGLLATVPAGEQPPYLVLHSDPHVELRADGRYEEEDRRTAYLYVFAQPALAPRALQSIEVRAAGRVHVHALETVLGTTVRVGRLMEALRALAIVPPVYTAHGGAEGTLEFAALPDGTWAGSRPAQLRHALDRADSPYGSLAVLRDAGVRFFSLVGQPFPGELYDLATAVFEHEPVVGPRLAAFPRLLPTRYANSGQPPRWSYGKDLANTQSLATNLDDILQRLHWAEPGQGGVLYTHLGHRVGNQSSPRLGWNEEMLAAWDRLAEFVHARDDEDPVPFRLWFAPSSTVLTFAWMMRRLPAHLRVVGNDVMIESWWDPVLGTRVADPAGQGPAWLHGITVRVPDEDAARVTLDGVDLPLLTRNGADRMGGPSVTIVDDTARRPLIPDEAAEVGQGVRLLVPKVGGTTELHIQVDAGDREWTIPIAPVRLRNATHWTFEVLGPAETVAWAIGFRSGDDVWHDAGTARCVTWTLHDRRAGGWTRYTLAFATARGWSRPRGCATAVRVRASGQRGELAFRDLCVVLPRGPRRPAGERVVGGTVIDAVTRRPAAGVEVVAAVRGGAVHRAEPTSGSGRYHIGGLPDGSRCRLDVTTPGRLVVAPRLRTAHLTCDQWDWDLTVC
jgi:hypothetical protein